MSKNQDKLPKYEHTRLIDAAPELFEAGTELIAAYEDMVVGIQGARQYAAFVKLKAAIAKARS